MTTTSQDFIIPGARVLWCPPPPPAGTMPPSHLVTVDSVHGDLVRIELVDHLGTITHRWVFVSELFPNPHDAN